MKIKAIKVGNIYLFPVTYRTVNDGIAEAWIVIDPVGITFVDDLNVEGGHSSFLALARTLKSAKEIEHVEIDTALRTEGDITIVRIEDGEFKVRRLVKLGY